MMDKRLASLITKKLLATQVMCAQWVAVDRTWKERLFTLPFRPFRKKKWVVVSPLPKSSGDTIKFRRPACYTKQLTANW